MTLLDIPMSGRRDDYVFYMRRRKLCRRRHVVPRSVRTAARRGTRGAFGAIAKAWSQRLTEEQRRAWMVSGARVMSHPRLWQRGPLTGEMHFTGINSARWRIGREILLWPPERVEFSPSPVAGLSIRSDNGRMRLRLRVSGPVAEDIMVIGQAPCSAGRKKWRHGVYLGLLPAAQAGESDITDLYVQRYGEPEPGKKIFIRTRQQKDGWEGRDQDTCALVPAKPVEVATLRPIQIRNPKAEARRKPEIRNPRPDGRGILCASASISVRCAMHKGVVPEQYRSASRATPVQCRRGTGGRKGVCAVRRLGRLGLRAGTRRKRHCRELWRGG